MFGVFSGLDRGDRSKYSHCGGKGAILDGGCAGEIGQGRASMQFGGLG